MTYKPRAILGTRVLGWWLAEDPARTPGQLARLLHASPATISRVLSGERGVGDDLQLAIHVHLPKLARRDGSFYHVDRDGDDADDADTPTRRSDG